MALITLLSCDELIAIVLLSVCAHKFVYFPFVDSKFKYPCGALLHLSINVFFNGTHIVQNSAKITVPLKGKSKERCKSSGTTCIPRDVSV